MIEPFDTSRAAAKRAAKLTEILADVAHRHLITPEQVVRAKTGSHKLARYEFCFFATKDTDATVREIATAARFKDWSGVTYAVRKYAIHSGHPARTFLELRKGVGPRVIDWPELARLIPIFVTQGTTQITIAKRCGVSRRVVQWALQGKPVSADDLIAMLLALGIAPESIVIAPLRALYRRARP